MKQYKVYDANIDSTVRVGRLCIQTDSNKLWSNRTIQYFGKPSQL